MKEIIFYGLQAVSRPALSINMVIINDWQINIKFTNNIRQISSQDSLGKQQGQDRSSVFILVENGNMLLFTPRPV
ncbi:TPA: hypothetical protein ACGRCR_003370 [Klebsiella michiganensis]